MKFWHYIFIARLENQIRFKKHKYESSIKSILPCSLFAIGKVSISLSGGDRFKVFKEGGRGRGMGIMVSGLELSLLLPPSWRSCIPIEGGLIGLGVLGWSQSELGLEFEFDLEGELPIPLFL